MTKRIFCVRAGKAGMYSDAFVDGGYVAIGWNDVRDLHKVGAPDEIKRKVSKAYPEYTTHELGQSCGEIRRFMFDIKPDDFVLTASSDGHVFVGKVLRNPVHVANDDDSCPYFHRRSVEWLEQDLRRNLPDSVQQSLGTYRHTVFEVDGGTSWVRSVRWDKFIEQAKAYLAKGKLEVDELKYKIEIGRKLAAARAAVMSGADGWESLVRSGIANNLIFHMTQVNLRNWMDGNPDHAREALLGLWEPSRSPVERIRQFGTSLPKELRGPGTCANIASVLLMGLDAKQYPPYRLNVFKGAYARAGYDQPQKGADSVDLYEHCLAFLDRFVEEANNRGMHVQNRLEAQSVVWAILQGDDDEGPGPPPGQTLLDLARVELYFPDASFLEEIDYLLAEKRQVIFSGTTGYGKNVCSESARQAPGGVGGSRGRSSSSIRPTPTRTSYRGIAPLSWKTGSRDSSFSPGLSSG